MSDTVDPLPALWASRLPLNVLAQILNHSDRRSIASLRAASMELKLCIDTTLQLLAPAATTIPNLTSLVGQLPCLRSISLASGIQGLESIERLREARQQFEPFIQALATSTQTDTLTLSTRSLEHLGRLAWAHWMYRSAVPSTRNRQEPLETSTAASSPTTTTSSSSSPTTTTSSSSSGSNDSAATGLAPAMDAGALSSTAPIARADSTSSVDSSISTGSSISQGSSASSSTCSSGNRRSKCPPLSKFYTGSYAGLYNCSSHGVLFVPHWFGALPRLQKLVLSCSATGPGSGSPKFSSTTMCCLWLDARAFQQLTALEVHGVNLQLLPPTIPQLRNLKQLTLRDCGFSAFPWELFRLSGLVELNLADNQLKRLPNIGWEAFKDLQVLLLSHHQLTSLPKSLSEATSLQHLELHHNQLHHLSPNALSSLTRLTYVDLSHNWLHGAPQLCQLLPCWPQLRWLGLRNVSDKVGALLLPDVLGRLQQLEELQLGDNFDLDCRTLEVLVGCPALQVLDFQPGCRGVSVPPRLLQAKPTLRVLGLPQA